MAETLRDDAADRGLDVTSRYTLFGPLRYHLERQIALRRAGAIGREGSVVIPKPPFADELTLEEELRRFERLKPRLNEVWDVISAQEDLPATSVVVPSLHARPGGAEQARWRGVLRGAAAVPADPAAQPARARHLRHVAAGAPADPRLLPAPAGRRAGQPRPRAADDAVHATTLAAAADAEDPRAAAPDRADPQVDPRLRGAPT